MANQRNLAFAGDFKQASLQTKMKYFDNHWQMKCPAGHVIISPTIDLGINKHMQCSGGLTPSLMKQKYDCYWQNSCRITWDLPSPIALGGTGCRGRHADIIATRGYGCVLQDNIIDICSHQHNSLIDIDYGIIRSHAIYPWNYRMNKKCCRKKIKVQQNQIMKVYIENVGVKSRESFLIRHIDGSRKKTLLRGNARNISLIVTKGIIHVKFKACGRFNSGKGFMLTFKRYHLPNLPVSMKEKRKKRHKKNRQKSSKKGDRKGKKRKKKRKKKRHKCCNDA